MNKKRLIILVTITIFVLLGIFFYMFFSKEGPTNQNADEAIEATNNFVEGWYTYNSQTEVAYLEKVKPMMTDKLYEETVYVHTQRPRDFEGQEPSSVTINESKLVTSDLDYAETRVEGTQTEGRDKLHLVLDIKLVKVDGRWLVSYFSPAVEQ